MRISMKMNVLYVFSLKINVLDVARIAHPKGGGASKKDFSDSLVMAVMKKIDQMRPCEKYVFSMKINV